VCTVYDIYLRLVVLIISTIVTLLFFFQAEDGIRDRNVTGVQTCALPIFHLIGESERIRPVLICLAEYLLRCHRISVCEASYKTWVVLWDFEIGHPLRENEHKLDESIIVNDNFSLDSVS